MYLEGGYGIGDISYLAEVQRPSNEFFCAESVIVQNCIETAWIATEEEKAGKLLETEQENELFWSAKSKEGINMLVP